jgi:hypothetical protein
MVKPLCFSFLAATLVACATGSTVTVIPSAALSQASTPTSPDNIKIFKETPPEGSYVPVAMLEASQAPFLPDDPDAVLGKMIARAGELGCDGLVIETQDQGFSFDASRITSGFWSTLPDDAVITETRFGSGRIADAHTPSSAREHWTLEGYRAQCVVLR